MQQFAISLLFNLINYFDYLFLCPCLSFSPEQCKMTFVIAAVGEWDFY